MKKKGFTLVELLAVIAILAILAILALPNIMNLFNQAKQNSFGNELKEIFKTAEQEWMKDSMIETNNVIYARCKTENCSNQLSLSGREEIDYYIEVDKAGKIIKYFATDGSYQYEYIGNGLKIEEIGNSKQVATLPNKEILTVNCSGAKKNGVDITSGIPLQGNNIAKDCSNNDVKNTIPSGARGLYKIIAEQAYLDNAKSTYVTRCEGVDFANISSDTNGKGVYELASTKNDLYPIYYYRGAVTNNNVKFGGFCWKAVRTTETGGVKLIYNGRPDVSGRCNATGESTQIKTSKFNDNSNSLAYVEYKYGTINGLSTGTPYTNSTKSVSSSDTYKYGTSVTYNEDTKKYTLTNAVNAIDNNHHYTCFNSSTTCDTVYYVYHKDGSIYYYITITKDDPNGRELNGRELIDVVLESMLRNDRDSTAKIEIDDWYKNNIDKNEEYKSKIEDTIYCIDRSISQIGGWSSTGNLSNHLYFSGYTRTFSSFEPSLACERELDRFTVSPSIGNGELKYPVGLLTTDEIMLAGGKASTSNSTYYLYTNQYYWASSPSYFFNDGAVEITVNGPGNVNGNGVSFTDGLRPVVSVSKNTNVTSGDGSANDPYVVE